MNFSTVKEKMRIKYIGNSISFGGEYTVITAESTYVNPSDCPDGEKGQLMIIEFMNNDTPMYFTLDQLDPNEWELA